jgi:WD40 repeat protein
MASKVPGVIHVVVSGDDRRVRVWDLATGRPIGGPFTGHSSWVQSVTVAELRGRPIVVSGSSDRTVRVWDLATGRPIGGPLKGHKSYVNVVAVAEVEGRPVAISGSSDRTVRVWDLGHRQAMRRRRPIVLRHPAPVLTVFATSYAGELHIFTYSADNVCRTWRLPANEIVSQTSYPPQSQISAVTALMSGSVLYACGSTIYVCHTRDSMKPMLAIQLDSEILAIAAYGGSIMAATILGLIELEIPPPK